MSIRYRRTFTSGGKQISTANQVIDFVLDTFPFNNCNAQYLRFETFEQPCRIKLNNEQTIHWIDVNSNFIIDEIEIDKITILDAGVSYYYTAMTAE